jgi:hypothetical protein
MESIPSQTRLTGLLRAFVEWAYLGDYQASVISKDVELDNHPQLAHLQL